MTKGFSGLIGLLLPQHGEGVPTPAEREARRRTEAFRLMLMIAVVFYPAAGLFIGVTGMSELAGPLQASCFIIVPLLYAASWWVRWPLLRERRRMRNDPS